MKKYSILKNFLIREYVQKNISIRQIAKDLNIDKGVISRNLKQYKIKKRTHSEATKGYNKVDVKVIDVLYYCKECKRPISYSSALYGKGMCIICAGLKSRNPNLRKIYRCKQNSCKNIIHHDTWKYGKGRCLSCAGKHLFKDKTKHPRWEGGKFFEPYPIEFSRSLKEQIRNRDKSTCQLCNITEKDYRQKLDIHHIDYDKLNLNFDNLISLCKSCHMKTNYNRGYWTKYFKGALKNENNKCTC